LHKQISPLCGFGNHMFLSIIITSFQDFNY
jgi:hypothetical protein